MICRIQRTVDGDPLARLQVPRDVVQRRVDGVARDECVVVASRRLEAPHARRHVAIEGYLFIQLFILKILANFTSFSYFFFNK